MRSVIDLSLSSEIQNAGMSESFRVGIKNAKADEPAELAIYGTIGDPWEGTDARGVGQFLRENKGRDIHVRINSGGGLAYDGITIYNALVAHDGRVTTTIEGMAGSAASVIAMAGQPVRIYENAQLFIHRALLLAIGNRDVMADAINWLDKIDEGIARTYKAKTNKALATIMELMRGKVDGTVFSAQEAVAQKFADELVSLKDGKTKNETGDVFAGDRAAKMQHFEAARAERIRQHREMFEPVA